MRLKNSFINYFCVAGILLAVQVHGQSLYAAPVCAKVFSSNVEASIDSLAQLRLFLDIEMSHGRSNAVTSQMSLEYQQKFQELAKVLGIGGSALAEQLRVRIPELQKEQRNIKVEDLRVRDAERISVGRTWNLEHHISGGAAPVGFIHYLPKKESVIEFAEEGPVTLCHLFNPQVQTLLPEAVHVMISSDGQHLMALDKKGLLHVLEMESFQEIKSLQLAIGKIRMATKVWSNIRSMAINESQSKIVLGHRKGVLYTFDLVTGELLGSQESPTRKRSGPIFMKFISDSEIIFSQGDVIARLDTLTQKMGDQASIREAAWINFMSISADFKTGILGFSTKDVVYINLTFDIQNMSRYEIEPSVAKFTSSKVPGQLGLLSMTSPSGRPLGEYRLADLTKESIGLALDSKYESEQVERVIYTADGIDALIYYYDRNSKQEIIDVWKNTLLPGVGR